jgi:glycopeptide antibiotics resistance protein
LTSLDNRRILLWYWLPWYVYTLTIYIQSSFPRPVQFAGVALKDFWIHPLEFMILALLTYRAFRWATWPELAKNYIRFVFLFSVLYAALDELHQTLVPWRTGQWTDAFWDSVGVVIGTVYYRLLRDLSIRTEMTHPQKRNLSIAVVLGIVLAGVVFQTLYDDYTKTRKAVLRRNFLEMKKREPTEGWITNLFFYVRKARSGEEADKKSRELLARI